MKTTFVVQGRKFGNMLEAIAFAEGQAKELDTSVDVNADVEEEKTEVRRMWVARMHPPGYQRPQAMDLTA